MKNIISLPFLNKLENKIGSWIFKNNSKYWFAEHSVARNVEGKSRTEQCFLWPRFWAYGLLPTLAVVLTQLDDSTASGSQLHRRAHSAHLHSLCYHRRENSDTEAPTHTQAANLSRHEGHRPIRHMGSFYNMLVAKQSYLANTMCVYFINFCSRKIVQILDSPMRKQILDNLKK